MTKQFLFLSFICVFALLLTSCGNPAKVLPSKDGKWTVTGTYTVTTSVTGFSDQVNSGNASGTADFSTSTVDFTYSGSTETYNWTYSDKKITLTQGSSSSVYEVTSASTKKEVWHRDETSSSTVLGITTSVRTVEDFTLSR